MERDAFAQCHPAVALVYFATVIVLTAVVQHPVYLTASLLAASAYHLLLRGRSGVVSLLGLVPLFVLVAAVNPLFNTRGAHVLFEVVGRPYTFEALAYGMAVAAMLTAMLAWFLCYGQVVTSDKVTSLFGNLAPALSMLVTMVLRLVPDLMRAARQIATARRCVGKGAQKGAGLRANVDAGLDALSALVDRALEGSVATSDSMRARGYGVARRTMYRTYRWSLRDRAVLGVQVVLLAVTLMAGIPTAQYTPVLSIEPLNWGYVAYCAFLALPFALRAKEAISWRISLWNI